MVWHFGISNHDSVIGQIVDEIQETNSIKSSTSKKSVKLQCSAINRDITKPQKSSKMIKYLDGAYRFGWYFDKYKWICENLFHESDRREKKLKKISKIPKIEIRSDFKLKSVYLNIDKCWV